MSVLCPDVLELILKKLPIETRLALRVRPNRVTPSDVVVKTAARMARIAAHPYRLRWVLARVKDHEKPMKVIAFSDICLDPYSPVEGYAPNTFYATPCRTMLLQAGAHAFEPFLHWECTTPRRLSPIIPWLENHLKEIEKICGVC